jgi:hypothetical protein
MRPWAPEIQARLPLSTKRTLIRHGAELTGSMPNTANKMRIQPRHRSSLVACAFKNRALLSSIPKVTFTGREVHTRPQSARLDNGASGRAVRISTVLRFIRCSPLSRISHLRVAWLRSDQQLAPMLTESCVEFQLAMLIIPPSIWFDGPLSALLESYISMSKIVPFLLLAPSFYLFWPTSKPK